MGATGFIYTHKGIESLQEAFNAAHAADAHENGHSYSGSLGSKGSVTLIQRTPLPYSEALKLAEQLIDSDDPRVSDKWGPAGALPFSNDPTPLSTRTENVKVSVNGKSADLSQAHVVHGALRAAAIEKVRLRKGERVVRALTSGDFEGRHLPPIDAEVRVKAAATPGKAVTRYVATDGRGRQIISWEGGLGTLAEARARVVEYAQRVAAENPGAGDETYNIQAVTRREVDAPLVAVKRETTRVSAEVELTIGTFSPVEENVQTGWLFFGWASS